MTRRPRTPCIFLLPLFLAACAVPRVEEPETIAVKASSLNPEVDTLTRLQSSFTQQYGDESLRVGDSVSSVGMWGTSVRYGGMQFGTRSDTRDDVINSNKLATSGVSVLPTVADALFASAGQANLNQQNLAVSRSLPSSGDSWNLVARDALGHAESISGPMIASTRLVREGCSDFSVGIGRVRQDYALTSNEYGPAFANTTVTCGAPLGFTVEGHGEYLADQVSALGVGVARKIGPIGTASVAFAQSSTPSTSGWLAKVGFEHSNSLFNVAWRSRYQSRDFRDIGTLSLNDPVMQRDLASVGVNMTKTSSLSLAYATQTTWTRERTNLIALKQSMGVGRGSLSMSAGHSLEDNFGSSLFISYKLPLGRIRPMRSAVEEFELHLPQSIGTTQSLQN